MWTATWFVIEKKLTLSVDGGQPESYWGIRELNEATTVLGRLGYGLGRCWRQEESDSNWRAPVMAAGWKKISDVEKDTRSDVHRMAEGGEYSS